MTFAHSGSLDAAFAAMIPKLLHEYLAEFKPEIVKRADYEIIAELEHCRVGVVLDTAMVGIWLSPHYKEGNPPPREIGLGWILEYLGLSEQKKIDWVRTPEQMRALLVNELTVLMEFCQPMLRGEFSQWAEINQSAVERADGFWERMDQYGLVWQVRRQALLADKQDDYAHVVRLFESIPDENLRPPDRRLLEKARKHLVQ